MRVSCATYLWTIGGDVEKPPSPTKQTDKEKPHSFSLVGLDLPWGKMHVILVFHNYLVFENTENTVLVFSQNYSSYLDLVFSMSS